MYILKSVLLYLFSILRNFQSNRGFLLRNSIELILKTWICLIIILTCFTRMIAEQSSVIQYACPMYHNERRIIVLSFPIISFVILIFVFKRFEIKSGFPFFDSHCIIHAVVLLFDCRTEVKRSDNIHFPLFFFFLPLNLTEFKGWCTCFVHLHFYLWFCTSCSGEKGKMICYFIHSFYLCT